MQKTTHEGGCGKHQSAVQLPEIKIAGAAEPPEGIPIVSTKP